MSNATTILFDLSGVRHVERDEFGDRVVHVETASDTAAAGCPDCAVVASSVKEYVTTTPRDIPYGDRGISVVWHKRRWRCGGQAPRTVIGQQAGNRRLAHQRLDDRREGKAEDELTK